MTQGTRTGRRWRLWAAAGFVLLIGTAALVGWTWLRDRVVAELAAWRAREAAAGREWTCPNETVSGFPFRIEVRCARPMLTLNTTLGRANGRIEGLTLVSLIYQPGHIVAEARGPFTGRLADGAQVDLNWRLLQTSASRRGDLPERVSFVIEKPALRITRPGAEAATLFGERIEIHARPSPTRYLTEGAVDFALSASGLASGVIDAAIGGRETLDLSLEASATRSQAFLTRGGPEALETWRLLGGMVTLSPLLVTKGPRRLLARGDLTLDETRRLAGRIDMAGAGLEDVYARLVGNDPRLGALVGAAMQALAGRQPATPDGLMPILPLRFEKGRFAFGPFPLGTLPPLY